MAEVKCCEAGNDMGESKQMEKEQGLLAYEEKLQHSEIF